FSVVKSPGNLNNLYGFPLALLNASEDNDWMVAEMGMSTPGELRELSLMARPDVVVFTNVRAVHLEFFASVDEIAEAKAELLAGISSDGVVIANADDPAVLRIAARHLGRVVRYGLGADAEVRAEGIEVKGNRIGTDFELVSQRGRQAVHLPLHGRYNVHNALAAAAAGLELGLTLSQVARALGGVAAASGRGIVHRLSGEIVIIDDSYNSNPAALSRALEAAAELPARRHWAVLGDMLELGPKSPDFHREAGDEARRLGFAPLFAVGEMAREMLTATEDRTARWFPDAQSAIATVLSEMREGDLVLVKGSRGIELDRVVKALTDARRVS
ncbi:MAG TPA: UDP-N-acetylmuramoyl-tripeptide--D-alanyl-D-alanine ligase, partial [Thermoanaerobaculia bacterium]|nr:UDP-N-acetylmuramoyl-tripeptide--D-alanyl-D-alanine ligase [Thermoanaerobaculia bacterium]